MRYVASVDRFTTVLHEAVQNRNLKVVDDLVGWATDGPLHRYARAAKLVAFVPAAGEGGRGQGHGDPGRHARAIWAPCTGLATTGPLYSARGAGASGGAAGGGEAGRLRLRERLRVLRRLLHNEWRRGEDRGLARSGHHRGAGHCRRSGYLVQRTPGDSIDRMARVAY